ncbi:MAG: preprotein translocase subunit SecY [Clostridiaceae bacterium]
MFSTLRDAWKVKDLRKKMIYTLLMLAVFRLGNVISVPGIDTSVLKDASSQQGSLFGFYDLISGGAFSSFSIFALGVIPYINASIIMQLLTIAIPQLEQLSKEGEDGRKKISQITRYLSIALGLVQAFSQYFIIRSLGAIQNDTGLTVFLIIVTLTAASTFLMWLGDRITMHGVGNGVSLLIFINIISRLPFTVRQLFTLESGNSITIVSLVLFLAILIAMYIGVIIVSLAERRIPVQYAGKTVGNKSFKGQSSHIPINITSSSVIAIIFAMSVMQFPGTLAQFWPTSKFAIFINSNTFSPFNSNSWVYALCYLLLIIFFTWFYTEITFKPDEMAENMHKSAGFIPGIRPGEHTARYIERILGKIALLGGLFAGMIAIIPILLSTYGNFKGVSFGGTSLLIMVGVALDTVRQIESQLVMRNYEGFLK